MTGSAAIRLGAFELRRAGLGPILTVPGVLVVGAGMVALTARGSGDFRQVAGTVLAALLPLGAGLAAGTVPAAETALELQLSLQTRYRVTLARRLLLVQVVTAALAVITATVLGATGLWRSGHGLLAPLVWLAPVLALSGLSMLLAIVGRGAALGGALIAGVWTAQQAYKPWFAAHRWTHPLFLFPDVRGGVVPATDWTANRLTLTVIGLACLALSWLLLDHPERLLETGARHRWAGPPTLLRQRIRGLR